MRVLIDLRTGEPSFDVEGNWREIDINRAFNQYLDVLFHTPFLSEPFVMAWGIPFREIFKASSTTQWESQIKYFIADALSKQKEPLVDEIESIEVEKNDNSIAINVVVKSKYGTTSRNMVELNV